MPEKLAEQQGAKSTPIEQGMINRVVSGVRMTVGGVLDAWFGPSNPIRPVAPDEQKGREFDYPVGYNLRITPRQEEPLSFPQLRALADSFDIVRLAIETRKDQMAKLDWVIQIKDKEDRKASKGKSDERMDGVADFLRFPDKEHDFGTWIRMILEDLLTIDAPAVYPRMTKGKKLYSLDLIDGATIKRVLRADGRTPTPPDVAYQQILHGVPAFDYTSDELVYRPRNIRTHKVYGFSPLEQVVMTVNIALRRQIYLLNYYTEGNIPDCFIGVPSTWTAENIIQFQKNFDSKYVGNLAERRKAKFIPGESTKNVHEIRDPKLKDEFDEWIARIVCYAFSLPPTAFTRQQNRATAETAQEVALQEGLAPIMQWVKSLLDYIITKYFGFPDLEFVWQEEQEVDQLKQAQINQIYAQIGVKTPEMIQAELGLEVDEGDNEPPKSTGSNGGNGNGKKKELNRIGKYFENGEDMQQMLKTAVIEKRGKKTLQPVNRNRPLIKQERTKLKNTIHKFFKTEKVRMAKQCAEAYSKIKKAEGDNPTADDIVDELDFQGWTTLINPTEKTLKKVYKDGSKEALAQIDFEEKGITSLVNEDALAFAEDRAAEMVGMKYVDGELVVNPNAEYAIDDSTRDYLREQVSKAIDEGWSVKHLADEIEDGEAFSESRAMNIAQTEIGNADVKGSMAAYKRSGVVDKKQWILGAEHPDEEDECDENATAGENGDGIINFDEVYPSGHTEPLAHPRCLCDIIGILKEEYQ